MKARQAPLPSERRIRKWRIAPPSGGTRRPRPARSAHPHALERGYEQRSDKGPGSYGTSETRALAQTLELPKLRSKTPRASARARAFESAGNSCHCGEARKSSVAPSSSAARKRRPMKLETLSRRRPLSSTGAGGVEARSRCAHRSPTRAGPFDAVIDVVRSRRLGSSAWLLLLPALGLLVAALFRC
jgi:hypothetical protein